MMCLRRSLLISVLVGGLACATPAVAQTTTTVDVHGTRIAFYVPLGYCRLLEKHPVDGEALQLFRRINSGRNELLLMFANCRQLENYRATGKMLTKFGAYTIPVSAAGNNVTQPREEFVAAVAKQVEAKMSAAEDPAGAVQEVDAKIALQQNVGLGLLHSDDKAAFIGAEHDWVYEGGEKWRMVVVSAMTVVRQKILGLHLSAPRRGRSTVRRLLASQRKNINTLIASNRG